MIKYLALIRGLTFPSPEDGFYLDHFLVIKNPKIAHDFLHLPNVAADLGHQSCGDFFYYNIAGVDVPKDLPPSDRDLSGQLNEYLGLFWFLRDNAIYTRNGFLYEQGQRLARFTQNVMLTDASGKSIDTHFSRQELDMLPKLKEAVFKHKILSDQQLAQATQSLKNYPGATPPLANVLPFDQKISRISRALKFLTYARANSFLPQKITFYIALLESLFNVGASELSHQISERVALYLSGSPNDKIATYEDVKAAYNIRSRYMHGGYLKGEASTNESLQGRSRKVDAIVRRVMMMVLLEDERMFLQNDDEMSKWFTSMIFR